MMFDDHGRIPIRSYRVVFRLERRIFQVDRFRLPFPYGIEVRALGYAVCSYLIVFVLSGLPLSRTLLGLLPAPVHWGCLPLGVVFALMKLRIDGRAPHKVLAALARWALRAKHLAGLRACPRIGVGFTPLPFLWMRPDWRATRYRPAVICGPAKITLRYPAAVEVVLPLRLRWRNHLRDPDVRQDSVTARRLVVRQQSGRPMYVGKTVDVPRGAEVVFK